MQNTTAPGDVAFCGSARFPPSPPSCPPTHHIGRKWGNADHIVRGAIAFHPHKCCTTSFTVYEDWVLSEASPEYFVVGSGGNGMPATDREMGVTRMLSITRMHHSCSRPAAKNTDVKSGTHDTVRNRLATRGPKPSLAGTGRRACCQICINGPTDLNRLCTIADEAGSLHATVIDLKIPGTDPRIESFICKSVHH